MAAFAHYWDQRCQKHPGCDSFRTDCYAASTEDLHSISRPSAAIIKNERSAGCFDVFTALDDRYGPTVMEVDDGRLNCYNTILVFLLFIFKANQSHSYQQQDVSALRANSEDILGEIFRNRLLSPSAPFAVEDYLKGFIRMDNSA